MPSEDWPEAVLEPSRSSAAMHHRSPKSWVPCRDPAGNKRAKQVDLNEAVRRLQQDARAQEEATQ